MKASRSPDSRGPPANRIAPQAPPAPLKRLGALAISRFMARYWQRRPVLMRQAIDGFRAPLTRAELFRLAQREDIESRLVDDRKGHCTLRHGPFSIKQLPSPTRAGWTLLVQGVDQHVQAAADLVARFRFIPDARLDDLMVSFASDGGGVGPHRDSYDVFLVQAAGRRRWRIQHRPDPVCIDGLPIQRLARFEPDAAWVLEPGDVLYLPPGVAHEGVAMGECITCSVGFRAPSWADLASVWIDSQADRNDPAPYRDRGLRPSSHPARLPPTMVQAALAQLRRSRPTRTQLAAALLRHLSEPKPQVVFNRRAPRWTRLRFEAALLRYGLVADRRTRMLYAGRLFAINGELISPLSSQSRAWMSRFADHRLLGPGELPAYGDLDRAQLIDHLYEWHTAGWVHHPH